MVTASDMGKRINTCVHSSLLIILHIYNYDRKTVNGATFIE